ncbi:MAG: TIGR03668 family PPOX class F420-dependent oxidoreductase [Nitrososphaerales archaeon]
MAQTASHGKLDHRARPMGCPAWAPSGDGPDALYIRNVLLSTARRLLGDARVGRLSTLTADLRPHVVPCCFALSADVVYSAVDAKPKSTLALRRLENLRAHPQAALLVDHYDEDWTALWWIRVDGEGRIVDTAVEKERALGILEAKYAQYRALRPPGDVIALEIERWRSWPESDPP